MSHSHYGSFVLNVTEAMKSQLISSFERLSPVELTQENLDALSKFPGVYRLFLDGSPVYVGKADKSLPQRLGKHMNKLRGRLAGQGSSSSLPLIERITFCCIYINEDLHALGPEKMLIQEFKAKGEAAWNLNGFGNNDPGKERDTSLVKTNHFDRLYPINLEHQVVLRESTKKETISGVLKALKNDAPFNIRFPEESANTDLQQSISELRPHLYDVLTIRQWLDLIARSLPDGWLITVLPGYVIIYPESTPERYPSRFGSWNTGATAKFTEHSAVFDEKAEIIERTADQ